jgi:hypothetical protein
MWVTMRVTATGECGVTAVHFLADPGKARQFLCCCETRNCSATGGLWSHGRHGCHITSRSCTAVTWQALLCHLALELSVIPRWPPCIGPLIAPSPAAPHGAHGCREWRVNIKQNGPRCLFSMNQILSRHCTAVHWQGEVWQVKIFERASCCLTCYRSVAQETDAMSLNGVNRHVYCAVRTESLLYTGVKNY